MNIKVIRTDTGHIKVGDTWFTVQSLVDAAFDKVKAAGSTNPAFDQPPFFYSGSPYGDAILTLGCTPMESGPKDFKVEWVCHDGKKPWRSRDPIWPELFAVDQALYEV